MKDATKQFLDFFVHMRILFFLSLELSVRQIDTVNEYQDCFFTFWSTRDLYCE